MSEYTSADAIMKKIEQLSSDIETLRRFVHGGDRESVALGGTETPSLRNMARGIDERESAAAQITIDAGLVEISGHIEQAQAWAESDSPPDTENQESKSSKTWAMFAENTADQLFDLNVAFVPGDKSNGGGEQGAVIYDSESSLLSFIVPYGPRGMQGIQGEQGSQGIQGESGIQGIQGIGEKGDAGIQGVGGSIGEQGVQGALGLQGIQGIQGIQGECGVQGIQGIQGNKGDIGERGLQGNAAPVGERGEKGEMGDSPWASAFGNFRLRGSNLMLDYIGNNEYNTFSINDRGELEVIIHGNT